MFKILKDFNSKPKVTTLDTIQYNIMKKNGICQIDNTHFSKTLKFSDINYLLAKEEDKETIFKLYCNFLNSFNEDTEIQFSFVNRKNEGLNDGKDFEHIKKEKTDGYEYLREEYFNMLKNQKTKGNNGIEKSKYITFTVEEKDLETAIKRLEKVEINIANNYKKLGVKTEKLDGRDRLRLFHSLINSEKEFNLDEEWKLVKEQGVPTKAIISPSYMNFSSKQFIEMDKKFYQTVYLSIDSSELSDTLLSDILDIEDNIVVTFSIKAIDRKESLKFIHNKDTTIKQKKVDYQQKAYQNGFSQDVLPAKLEIFEKETDGLLYDLQYGNEKMFLVTILISFEAESEKELDTKKENIKEILNKYFCSMTNLSYRQEQALNTILPIGKNKIEMDRMLTTSSLAIFIPFLTQELFQSSNKSLYYGLNALSNNMIMCDRTLLKNPNGLVLGTPGSGKSFSAKREMINAVLITEDDVVICDPESEYGDLVKAFGGQTIKISPVSKEYINPLDIDITGEEDPLPLKSDFILSLFELVTSNNNSNSVGLSAAEISIIDRCLPKLYKKYFENPVPENMPILSDLYMLLKEQGDIGENLATEMEIYVKGSLNIFNHRSNINIKNRLISFDIKEIGKQLQKIGMLIIYDAVWNRVSKNRHAGKTTRYYIDEFHLLLNNKQTAQYSVEMWKRFRKWGGIPTGITQNVKDLLKSKEIENIFDNTDFIYLLNQSGGDKEELARRLNISEHQLSYITDSGQGEGLIKYNELILPFRDDFPKDTKLYKLMTTNFNDLNNSKYRRN
ncbi:VirB4-like conjugal transfer ATPase, CD1110 family [Parvimonas parva]|uniref:VirB4-like conjugal transfer ATPase, CD1110 family n=1 Tax=Parvimonas parva TaxID=2769485 RepID=UPI00061DABAE|nr:conjugal transfer protein TraE [Parvimonas parva]